jgi:hypothetical protein
MSSLEADGDNSLQKFGFLDYGKFGCESEHTE